MATFLAGVTYFLLKNPSAYRKLKEEIRARFQSLQEITATTAQQLPYLQAVISEGLRSYPPGSQGFPRVCPGAMVDGVWVPKGVSYTHVHPQPGAGVSVLTRHCQCRQRCTPARGPSPMMWKTFTVHTNSNLKDGLIEIVKTIWRRANHFHLVREAVWGGSECPTRA